MRDLLPFLMQKGSATLHRCCLAAMLGDASALPAIHDLAQEEGLLPMQSLKVGDYYLLKTLAHYYYGRVTSVTFCDVVLMECSCVFGEGSLPDAYKDGGKWEQEEMYPPDAEVVVNVSAIVAAIPRPKKRGGNKR